MKKVAVVVCSLLLLLLACVPKAAPPAAAPAVSQPPAPRAEAAPVPVRPAWEVEWEKVLEAARKEGKVVLYTSRGADMRIALTNVFVPKYGIKLEAVSGRGTELSLKILAERRANLNLVDVHTSGASPPILDLKPVGALESFDKALILPEVTDTKLWYGGKLPWADKDHTVFSFLAYQSGEIGVNTNLVKPGEIKSLKDLLNPKWKGKIIINDPTVTGTGSKMIGVVAENHGWDIWRQIAKQEPLILRDQRLMIDWLAQGKYAVVVPPETDPFNLVLEAGAPVARVTVAEAAYITGDVLTLVKDAPHPNASKVFINWLLSKEGQTVYSKMKRAQSAREDITVEGIRAREPGVNYFDSNGEVFTRNQAEAMRVAKEVFGPLMK